MAHGSIHSQSGGHGWQRFVRLGKCLPAIALVAACMCTGIAPGWAQAKGTTLYVDGGAGALSTNCSQPAHPCSTIGAALAQARSKSSITTIDIAGKHHNFNGSYCEQVTISRSLTVQGWETKSHPNPPTIDGGSGTNNCPKAMAQSLVSVGKPDQTAMTVTLRNLIIQGGDASNNSPQQGDTYRTPGRGGAIFVYPQASLILATTQVIRSIACSVNSSTRGCDNSGNPADGGGIYDDGSVTLDQSLVSNNLACAGSCDGYGGGIFVNHGAFLTVERGSVIASNEAMEHCTIQVNCSTTTANGGGIYSFGVVTVTASTVRSNYACAYSGCNGYGGGIANWGRLSVTSSTVDLNYACYAGGTQCSGFGGGIYANSFGDTNVLSSTISENVACYACGGGGNDNGSGSGEGGGIYTESDSPLTLTGSTLSSNIACSGFWTDAQCVGRGGGIVFTAGHTAVTNTTIAKNIACGGQGTTCLGAGGGIRGLGKITLTNSTVSGNFACRLANSSTCSANGGGIELLGQTAFLSNTILAGNQDTQGSPNCSGGALADGKPDGTRRVGSNVLGPTSGCTTADLHSGNIVNVADPKLGPLTNNGGPVETMALLPGSPANGNANGTTCALKIIHDANGGTDPGPAAKDERGEPRPIHGCDVGAYQRVFKLYIAPNGSDTNNCFDPKPISGDPGSGPCRTISRGIIAVADGGTIHLAGGTYCGLVFIVKSLNLVGTGSGTILDGGAGRGNACAKPLVALPVVAVGSLGKGRVTASIQGVTMQHGNGSPLGAAGGMLVGGGTTLTVSDSTIRDNVACDARSCSSKGDGVGGGIYIGSGGSSGRTSLTIVDSTISGNTGCQSPCQSNSFAHGGGIYNTAASLTLENSTISGNTAVTNGGGAGGGLVNSLSGTATVVNSTIAANTACTTSTANTVCAGGGIEDTGTLTLVNSTVSRNVVCVPTKTGSCIASGGGIDNNSDDGLIRSTNTMLAQNFATPGIPGSSPDCKDGVIDGVPNPASPNTVAGNNLIGNDSGCIVFGLTSHDQLGTPAAPIYPKFDPKGLAWNGGPTQTIALEAKSPAIGKGDPGTCRLSTVTGKVSGPNNLDERGYSRQAQSRRACDIGAYDSGGPPALRSVSPHSGPVHGGNTVTIKGVSFGPGATVKFGGKRAGKVTLVSGSHLTAVAPAHSRGTVDVTVTTTDGTTAVSRADRYRYVGPK